jgi:hypothetical protein
MLHDQVGQLQQELRSLQEASRRVPRQYDTSMAFRDQLLLEMQAHNTLTQQLHAHLLDLLDLKNKVQGEVPREIPRGPLAMPFNPANRSLELRPGTKSSR